MGSPLGSLETARERWGGRWSAEFDGEKCLSSDSRGRGGGAATCAWEGGEEGGAIVKDPRVALDGD